MCKNIDSVYIPIRRMFESNGMAYILKAIAELHLKEVWTYLHSH